MQPSPGYSASCLQCIRNTRHRNDAFVYFEPLPFGDFGPAVNGNFVEASCFGAMVVVFDVAKKDGVVLNIAIGYFSVHDFELSIVATEDVASSQSVIPCAANNSYNSA